MDEDNRFAHIATDPKFRRIPKSERRVKVDKRFKSMFKSKQFKVKYTVDKRGRPVNHTSSEDLKRYYELSSGTEDSDKEGESEIGKYVRAPKTSDVDDDLPKIPEKVKKKLHNLNIDYARGESNLLSESSSDDEGSTVEDDDDTVEHAWGELDYDADRTDEISHRLAVCNMDWDRIKAVDLMVLLSSFLPPGGLILNVKIYPSEFGLQRMKEEEIKGPTELTQINHDNSDGEEGSKYHMEKLRQYQLNRLKYYYAVVTCDGKNTANKLYTDCDGMEYESSATKMDLRFIPDDMEFDQEPKEICEKLPEPGKYLPRFFTTTALQQAKVNLTWDETNPDRIEITQKLASGKVDDVSDGDIQAYLASSSEEDNNELVDNDDNNSDLDDKKTSLDKYKLLLDDINNQENAKKQKDVEMEVTWGIDIKDKTEKIIKKKLDEKQDKTPFQKYLDKRKEKRKQKKQQQNSESDTSIPSDVDMNDPYFAEELKDVKRTSKKQVIPEDNTSNNNAELELLVLNQQDDKHFNFNKIQETENKNKSKKKKKIVHEVEEDNFQINVEDPRFSALYSSHHYNVDPTDPHFKNTKGMEAIKTEKLKRRNVSGGTSDDKQLKQNKNAELSVLVKSVKRKTEALGNNKQKRKF